jgi:hypothetical protein
LFLADDGWSEICLEKHGVHKQAADTTVAAGERMDLLEATVYAR